MKIDQGLWISDQGLVFEYENFHYSIHPELAIGRTEELDIQKITITSFSER